MPAHLQQSVLTHHLVPVLQEYEKAAKACQEMAKQVQQLQQQLADKEASTAAHEVCIFFLLA